MIEITHVKNLEADMTVPGDKYIANRVLLMAAIAEGESIIKNIPDNEDITKMIEALKKFGVVFEKRQDALVVHGGLKNLMAPKSEIDVGDSGTLMRFITGFSSLIRNEITITGKDSVKARPMLPLLHSLSDLGIASQSFNNGFLPIKVKGGTLEGGETSISGSISSQFISSLLLVSPYAEEDVEITVKDNLVSKRYVDLTISLMEKFGVKVENNTYRKFTIRSGQRYKSTSFSIPGDWSSASYFFAASAVLNGTITLHDLDSESLQGESDFPSLLLRMGCIVKRNKDIIQVKGKQLNAITVDMSDMPDVVQTLAVVAAFAKGKTKITNIAHLRFKESNRIRDTAVELRRLGVKVEETENTLTIHGGNPKSVVIDSHNDHRMAMSFAIAGLKIGLKIKDPECVNKSFPEFWTKLKQLGAGVNHV